MAGALSDDFDPAELVRDYGDIDGEVRACRDAAALFDYSFLAAARVSGPAALETLAAFTNRPLEDLASGRIAYALRSDQEERLRADLTIWNEGKGHYFVMSGRRQEILELEDAALSSDGGCRFDDFTDRIAVLALQGPDSLRALEGIADLGPLARIPYFGFADTRVDGLPCRVGRLGYTGERGFEIVVPAESRGALWRRLAPRARPCGFAAADCLRIEAGFVLFGNEFRLPVTAAEAGLEAFVRASDGSPRFRLVCLAGHARRRPVLWRAQGPCRPPERGTVTVTSACYSALAGRALGLGYVRAEDAVTGNHVVDPGGLFDNPEIVQRPFFDPAKRRPRGSWELPSTDPLPSWGAAVGELLPDNTV